MLYTYDFKCWSTCQWEQAIDLITTTIYRIFCGYKCLCFRMHTCFKKVVIPWNISNDILEYPLLCAVYLRIIMMMYTPTHVIIYNVSTRLCLTIATLSHSLVGGGSVITIATLSMVYHTHLLVGGPLSWCCPITAECCNCSRWYSRSPHHCY